MYLTRFSEGRTLSHEEEYSDDRDIYNEKSCAKIRFDVRFWQSSQVLNFLSELKGADVWDSRVVVWRSDVADIFELSSSGKV